MTCDDNRSQDIKQLDQMKQLQQFQQRFPKFFAAGLKLPPCALEWDPAELELFVASAGFARLANRSCEGLKDSLINSKEERAPEKDIESEVVCVGYMEREGCGWTRKFHCPGQQRGTIGAANDDGSEGYECCCKRQLWKVTEGNKLFSQALSLHGCRKEVPKLALPALKAPPSLTDLGEVLASKAPKVIWTYWHDDGLSDFHRLCLETWRLKNPGWVLVLLNKTTLGSYLNITADLPIDFHELSQHQQADAIRLALLDIHGGVWTDVTTICVKALDEFCYDIVSRKDRVEKFAAFFFETWDRMYVENWFLACHRGHPFVHKWREHFNELWSDYRSDGSSWRPCRTRTGERRYTYQHPMFQNVNLSHLTKYKDNRHYLSMHSTFAKVVQEDRDMHRIWDKEMLLLRAGESALWHLEDEEVHWDTVLGIQKWLHHNDTWVQRVLQHSPILKFTFQSYKSLQSMNINDLLLGDGCLCSLFRAIFGFDRDAYIKVLRRLNPKLNAVAEVAAANQAIEHTIAREKFIMDYVEQLARSSSPARDRHTQSVSSRDAEIRADLYSLEAHGNNVDAFILRLLFLAFLVVSITWWRRLLCALRSFWRDCEPQASLMHR